MSLPLIFRLTMRRVQRIARLVLSWRQEDTLPMDLHFTILNLTGPMLCSTGRTILVFAGMSLMPQPLLY